MKLVKPHANRHYRARLIAWSLAMLAWVAWVVSADVAPSRRRMRRRYGFISLDRLARDIALLIVIRAKELAGGRRASANPFFSRIRGRDRWPRHIRRSIIGSRLRRALKHKHFTARIAILTDALRHLDVWAARYVKRMRRGLTRLWPVRTKPQPSAIAVAMASIPAFFVDDS